MIGPSGGVAAVIPMPALDTDLILTCGQFTSDADNNAMIAARTANDASAQVAVSRPMTMPLPPGIIYAKQMIVFGIAPAQF